MTFKDPGEPFRLPTARLDVDGKRFFCTFDPSSRDVADIYAARIGGVIRDFGVRITEVRPGTNEVTNWERVEGFSVWK